ncbi:FadD3 family acyl-CoA ligase [Nocardia pseudobrasiliensis]|uniref:Acyl-CoA synthetase (AMP-forming)/AMP-acid ligase II n=1 Tax=Nocardia pseudobrasiliensis TaxID=45979 RepID=A0A370I624_9NOCA|nr:FadD3 family acyl-CoA ligase [Nocardia pseudobrasiliensis]RDI66166.1 acyl-CoA synthetase (AMP-forming)/AMP-acid ligase II [Nocardia pseudobrasiliensis]
MTTLVQTIPLALREAAREFGDDIAISDGATRLSWAQLLDAVRETAAALIARGVERGDRVAIWAPNTWHWVVAALGAQYAGAALVPLNTRYVAEEALDVLERVDARALFVSGSFLGRDRLAELRSAAPKLAIDTVILIPGDAPSEPDDALAWSDLSGLGASVPIDRVVARGESVGPEDISDILFTSGTTGRSKGTLVAHRQALSVVRAWVERATLRRGDAYLVIPPFFHNFGYKAAMLACLVTGATIVPQASFDVPETMRMVRDQRITVLTGPPTIYQTILDHPRRGEFDLSSLRVAVTGAATVPVVLIERMRGELEFDVVVTAYGLSESAGFGTMCRPDDDPETIANTCGEAIAEFELRVGDNGEVLLRGPNVMVGYLDDPESTAKTIDADGWLHTGDIGIVDDRGYLKITDRLKDMYISGGFNVYPAEVEQVLARLDGVAEAAVIGVPDERLGEVGKAYVVRRAGSTLSEQDVIDHARGSLANFKVPRRVEFRDALPYSAAGKVLKRQLREEIS